MRMYHRLFNPRPRRRRNARKAEELVVGPETVHINTRTGTPDFLYQIIPPSSKGDRWDYYIRSLGGQELRSGAAGNEKEVKKFVREDLKSLTLELTAERKESGLGGAFEAQTYTELDPLFPGQIAQAPVEEYQGFSIFVRRESPETNEPAGYYYYVESDDKEYQSPEYGPIPSRGEAESRAHLTAGTLAGMREFMEANPSARRKMKKWIEREQNPNGFFGEKGFLEKPVAAQDISKTPLAVGIPNDPAQAALMGYYMGVLRGMKTCGVAKTYERFKIRRRIKKLLDEALHEQAEAVVAPRAGQRVRRVY